MKRFAPTLGAALVALAAFITGAPEASAQPKAAPQPLESKIEQRKVARAADGAETLVAVDTVKPGDVIEYVATYRNTTRAPLSKVEATLPIPSNTEFVPGTVRPATAKASADGRNYGDLPLKRVVKRNGVDVEEQVPVREYRYLRWYPGVIGGEQAVAFTARVRVVDDRSPSEPGKQGERK